MPLASYLQQARGAGSGVFGGLFGTGSRFFRVALVGLAVLLILALFGFLGSSLVANRYQFHEVQTAPGRSEFYRIDRWTGEMTRCQTDYRMLQPPDGEAAPPPVC